MVDHNQLWFGRRFVADSAAKTASRDPWHRDPSQATARPAAPLRLRLRCPRLGRKPATWEVGAFATGRWRLYREGLVKLAKPAGHRSDDRGQAQVARSRTKHR